MKRRLRLSLAGVLLLSFLAVGVTGIAWVGEFATEQADDAYVQYDRETDLLSVRAHQVPLNTLLQEIAKKAGLRVESRKDELLREQVSLEVKGLPLEQALKQLLRQFNSVFLYSTDTTAPRVVRVVILSKKSGVTVEARAPKDEAGTDGTRGEPGSDADRRSVGSLGAELIRALADKQSAVATAIIETLERSSNEQRRATMEALLETLKDGNFPAHDEVIAALRRLSVDKAVESLTSWLHGDDQEAAMAAAIALARLGGDRAVDELRVALVGKDVHTRHAAAKSLAQIGGDKAVASLLDALNHRDVDVRRAAIAAISESDDPRATQALASVVTNESDVEGRKVAAFHLVERDGPAAIPALERALRDSDPRVRLFAAAFSGRLGKAAEPLLREALKDTAPEVRATAAAWLQTFRERR